MKALSIRQPWPWAILNGNKRLENRDWKSTNPNLRFRGTFLIQTSLTFDRDDVDTVRGIFSEMGLPPLSVPRPRLLHANDPDNPYPLGGIVGQADVVDIVTRSDSPWFFGPLALVLDNVKPLPFVPCKGALGFFKVPAEVEHQIRMAA